MSENQPLYIPGSIKRGTELAYPSEVDAFIIHGKNWENNPGLKQMVQGKIDRMLGHESEKPFKLKLSKDSRITALAAGIIWEYYAKIQEKPPILIFSTGKTAGKDQLSEAQAMIDYMKIRFPDIPEDFIKLEDESYDTPGNIINSKQKIKELGLKNVGYLTVGYHNPRVAILMDYYDLPIQTIHPTEQILRRRSRRHSAFVEGYTHSKEWQRHRKGEATLIMLSNFDLGRKSLATMAKVIRHR